MTMLGAAGKGVNCQRPGPYQQESFGRYSEGGSSRSRSEQPRTPTKHSPPPSTKPAPPPKAPSSYPWRHMALEAARDDDSWHWGSR
eukprot:4624349-Karenia_brevis.AAC.1